MKLKLKRSFMLLFILMILGVGVLPKSEIKAATCKTDTYNYYFLTHYNEETDYEELMASTESNPILVESTGHFINLWGDDAKIVSETVSNSFTDLP